MSGFFRFPPPEPEPRPCGYCGEVLTGDQRRGYCSGRCSALARGRCPDCGRPGPGRRLPRSVLPESPAALKVCDGAPPDRVPTRSVRKYTPRTQLKPLGAPEPASAGRGRSGGGGRPARLCDLRAYLREAPLPWAPPTAAVARGAHISPGLRGGTRPKVGGGDMLQGRQWGDTCRQPNQARRRCRGRPRDPWPNSPAGAASGVRLLDDWSWGYAPGSLKPAGIEAAISEQPEADRPRRRGGSEPR